MLYVSVRWSRFVEEILRRSAGRMGRIVDMLILVYSPGSPLSPSIELRKSWLSVAAVWNVERFGGVLWASPKLAQNTTIVSNDLNLYRFWMLLHPIKNDRCCNKQLR